MGWQTAEFGTIENRAIRYGYRSIVSCVRACKNEGALEHLERFDTSFVFDLSPCSLPYKQTVVLPGYRNIGSDRDRSQIVRSIDRHFNLNDRFCWDRSDKSRLWQLEKLASSESTAVFPCGGNLYHRVPSYSLNPIPLQYLKKH